MVDYSHNFKTYFFCLVIGFYWPADGRSAPNETSAGQERPLSSFFKTSLPGYHAVDPNQAITLQATGLSTRLSKVELVDSTGTTLFVAQDQTSVNLPVPLAFGASYTIRVSAEQAWTNQSETQEINFTTVAVPKLEGPVLTLLGPDAAVNLHFDLPVSDVRATGDLALQAEADATGQNIRLLASHYAQARKYEIQLNYKTSTGVPVPPVSLELTTPPPLFVKSNIKGLTNLGLMLPLQITFSEALANRADAANNIRVQAHEGNPIPGKWSWNGSRQLKFTPNPAWPASSTIDVTVDDKNLKSVQGGTLEQPLTEQFSTGTDRRLVVYLDTQRVEAVENDKVIRTFKVSTGKSKTPTVTGSYYIYDRYRHKTMRSDVDRGQRGFYEVKNVPYTQFFHKDFAFHGAFWHNNFGNPASHGCVNMATKDQNKRWPNAAEDAGWLYQWGALGVPVTVLQKAPVLKEDVSQAPVKKPQTSPPEPHTQPATPAASQKLPGKDAVQPDRPV